MRFVPIKNEQQQATLTLHRTRELLIRQRTMCVNALRGHLTEFGLVVAKGIGHAVELIDMAENDAALPEIAKSVVKIFAEQLAAIQASIAALEKEIAGVHAQSPMSQLLAGIPGVGKIIASAIVASVPDPKVFKWARGFAAWIGLVPRQNSYRRQDQARLHYQKGRPLSQKAAGVGRDLGAARGGQAQRRPARLARHASGKEEIGAARLIPTRADQNRWAQSRSPMDMMRQG